MQLFKRRIFIFLTLIAVSLLCAISVYANSSNFINKIVTVKKGDFNDEVYIKIQPADGVEQDSIIYIKINENAEFPEDLQKYQYNALGDENTYDYLKSEYTDLLNEVISTTDEGKPIYRTEEKAFCDFFAPVMSEYGLAEFPFKLNRIDKNTLEVTLFCISDVYAGEYFAGVSQKPNYKIHIPFTAVETGEIDITIDANGTPIRNGVSYRIANPISKEYDSVLGLYDAGWANEGVAMWKLPDEKQTKDVTYYLKLYKDNKFITQKETVILSINNDKKRASYDFNDIIKENGEGVYTFSFYSEDDNTEKLSSKYFYSEKIETDINDGYGVTKFSREPSEEVYVSVYDFAQPYSWTYDEKENSKFEIFEINHYSEYYEGLESDNFLDGGVWSAQYEFIPKEPGEETIEYVFYDYDDDKLKTISLKYRIDENLEAEYVGYEIKPVLVGDIDNDGIFTSVDVSMILQFCLNDKFISPIDKLYSQYYSYKLYDFNGDGEINSNDAVELLNNILGN